ncbi:MAG: hypothetical protein AB7N99_01165 [Simkaniaceae bacterium]
MSSSPLMALGIEVQNSHSIQQFRKSNIACFMDNYLILEIKTKEGSVHLVARRVLQGMSVVAGFLGRIPFIKMNLELGGDHKVYGGFLAYGTCASFGYLVSYSLLEIINSLMAPLSEEERVLVESRINATLKKAFFVAATILGFASQIPFVYIAYKYNEPSTLNPNNLVMPTMVFAIDSWVSVYSAQMGMITLRERQSLTAYEKQLTQLRGKMYALIEQNRSLLAFIGEDTQKDFVSAYDAITRIDNASDRVKALYDLFISKVSNYSLEPPAYTKYVDGVVKAYGYLCAACNIGTLAYIAWTGMDELAGSIWGDSIITGLYVGSALYLNTTAIPQTAVKLFNLFKSIFICGYQPTLADHLTPKLSFTLKALGLATAALSYGPAVKLSKDYFGFNDGLEIFMEITLSCAVIFLVSMAILAITDKILEYKVEKMGSDNEKALMAIHQKMKHFSSVLSSSPLLEVAIFLKILPEETIENLIQNTDISLANLENYIEQHLTTEYTALI